MMRYATYILTILLLVSAVSATNYDGGTRSPFSMGAGARDLALGGANLTDGEMSTAAYWNASRLTRAERFSISGFHSRLFDNDVAYQYLGLVVPTLDLGTFGFGVFRLAVDGIEKRDVSNNFYQEYFQDSRLGFYLAYAQKYSGFDFGLALNLENHSLGDYSATSSPGVSFSVSRYWNFSSSLLPRAAVTLNAGNVIQTKLKLLDESITYPVQFDLAGSIASTPFGNGDHVLGLSAKLTKIKEIDPKLALGLEYSAFEMIHLRGGLNDSRLSFGAGLSYMSIDFDYAMVDRDLDILHVFSLTTSFGTSRNERLIRRAKKREAEFNNIMSERLASRNHQMISDLVIQGRQSLQEGDLVQAENYFDRSLFLARNNGVDTTEIVKLAEETRGRLEELTNKQVYAAYLDSADVKLQDQDYLAARYFAGLALQKIPNSGQAKEVYDKAQTAIEKATSQEELIQNRLAVVDSLMDIGRYDQALNVVRSLSEFAPNNSGVQLALKRAEFERLREEATLTYTRENLPRTMTLIDSALALFPGHQWWLDFKKQVQKESRRRDEKVVVKKPETPTSLSPEIRAEVEADYETAQNYFKEGNLTQAIILWEKVEQLAPNYASVREYLVNAYKFVGVELYSQNNLQDAIDTWKKALRLEPGNDEIARYIRRTENEIRKLHELSYDEK